MPDMEHICIDHPTGDGFLDAWIADHLEAGEECSICKRGPAAPLLNLALEIQDAVEAQLSRDEHHEIWLYNRHGVPIDGEPLEAVLEGDFDLPHEWVGWLAEALRDASFDYSSLEHGFFEPDANYSYRRIRGDRPEERWREFCKIAMEGPRFFNAEAKSFLDHTFQPVMDDPSCAEHVIRPEETIVYRGRDFGSVEDAADALKEPHEGMGAPPSGKASGLRMNAPGSPILYTAEDTDTVLRELRPAVGSWVVVLALLPKRDVRVLDLQALEALESENPYSLFDSRYVEHEERNAFLASFADKLTRPIPGSNAERDYRPSQMVANYIQNVLGFEGIRWKTTQGGNGRNIAFFASASVLEAPMGDDESGFAYVDVDHASDEDAVLMGVRITREEGKNDHANMWPAFDWTRPSPSFSIGFERSLLTFVEGVTIDAPCTYSVAFDDTDPKTRAECPF